MNDTKDKFCIICYTLNKTENGWSYWKELLESHKDDDDYELLKSKMNKVTFMLNNDETSIINLDVEKELWNLI